ITLLNNLFWLILAVVFCLPIVKEIKREVSERMNAGRIQVALCGQAFINLALLLICTAQLVGQSYNPFLYYRF
ncbi:MAG: MBOAT family protein, partial [Anaerotruncus rubiinfantis]